MRRHGVKHPVAQDNRYGTWKAYSNQYWPATYLIDAQGRIRYKHFGEGEYERTEGVIRTLAGRAGPDRPDRFRVLFCSSPSYNVS